ncbi:MAG: transcription termination factor NusA [Aggregatilineaceae bacterium]
MKSDFILAFNEIVDQRSLPREVVMEALSQALITAYKRDANIGTNQQVEARIEPTGEARIYLEKEVVESVESEQTEVSLKEARKYVPDAQIGDTVMVPVQTSANFGRIAAQTAKQVILQRIREAERDALYEEFVEREGDLVTGTVQSVSHGTLTISLGRAEAVMPRQHQIPGEKYRPHDKIRAYVAEVKRNSRGPQIVLSRAHKNMLRRLLEYEVPEIYNGQVEIKNIAREAGYRSKVAVAALQEGIDPVGACVGMRGIRIQNIVKELNEEKIDVIEWNPDPAIFIAKALSPARISDILLEEDLDTGRTATVIVPDDQLSLAIGREGQNARLAAKLTGWRVDIKSVSEAAEYAFAHLDEPPLNALREEMPTLIAEIERIMEKKQANRVIQPEEYKTLTDFVKVAERRLQGVREEGRSRRREAMEKVRALVPERAYRMSIEELELDEDINKALARIENVGELMVRLLADEENLARMLEQGGAGDDALEAIRYAVDDLVIRRPEEPQPQPAAVQEEAPQLPAEPVAVVTEPAPKLPQELMPELRAADLAAIEEEAPPAFVEPEPAVTAPLSPEAEERRRKDAARRKPTKELDEAVLEEDELEIARRQKKGKRKPRELIFDEERGRVVARKQRKGGRRREEWEDFLE